MSWDSVDRIKAYRFGEHVFVEMVMADSNCYEEGGKMATRLYGLRIGLDWQVMASAVELSSSCEGGMLRSNRREVKAETLIGRFRKAIKDAEEVETFSQLPKWRRFELLLSPKIKDAIIREGGYRFDKLVGIGERRIRESKEYGDVYRWENTPEDIKAMMEAYCLFREGKFYYNTQYTYS